MRNFETPQERMSGRQVAFALLIATALASVGCSNGSSVPTASLGTQAAAGTGTTTSSYSQDAIDPSRTQQSVRVAVAASPTPVQSATATPEPTTGSLTTRAPSTAYATATPAATARTTASPRPTPTPKPNPAMYDPVAGTFPYFPNSVFHQLVTPLTGADPRSAGWLAAMQNGLGDTPFGEFQFAASATPDPNDYMFPVYEENPTNVPYTVHCTAPYGTTQNPDCAAEGITVHLPPLARPQDSSSTSCGGDCHIALVDQANNREIDLFGVSWPPTSTTLTVAWAGVCPLSNTGYDSCAATGSSNALTQGAIRATDLVQAVQNGGTLPSAIAVSTPCNYQLNPPFTGSDGHCLGGPPEGAHVYLQESIAQINAYRVPAISKAIMRTLAVYGAYITDVSGGSPGFSVEAESGQTYTAMGKPNPWLTKFVPEARREGIDGGPWNGTYYAVPPYPAQMFRDLVFAPLNPANTAYPQL